MLSLSAENVALEVNSHPYAADHHEDVQVDFNSVMGCLSEGLTRKTDLFTHILVLEAFSCPVLKSVLFTVILNDVL